MQMIPQTCKYVQIDDEHMALQIQSNMSGKTYEAIFDADLYYLIKLYKWKNRGKNVILNEFGVTLANFIADKIGYDSGEWVRKANNNDFRTSNYTTKLDAIVPEKVAATAALRVARRKEELAKRGFDPCGVALCERVKYKTQNECVDLKLSVIGSEYTITIQINKFLIQYVPTKIRMIDGVVCCPDNTPLKIVLFEKVWDEDDVDMHPRRFPSITWLHDELDLRIDTGARRLVSHVEDVLRYHYVHDDDTDEDLVVIEAIERRSLTRFNWVPTGDLFKLPNSVFSYEGMPRVAYVVVDEDVADLIASVRYCGTREEWLCYEENPKAFRESNIPKARPLKRVVAEAAGMECDNVYVNATLSLRYKKALDCNADLTTPEGRRAARIRYRYENRMTTQRMGVDGYLQRRRQVIADKLYFCPYIYGGVGVWCADLRKRSVRLKGIQEPQVYNGMSDNGQSTTKTDAELA